MFNRIRQWRLFVDMTADKQQLVCQIFRAEGKPGLKAAYEVLKSRFC
jgi:hypothetical protein